jgi:hypothetical protein
MFIDYRSAKDAHRAHEALADWITIQFPTRDIKPVASIKNSGGAISENKQQPKAKCSGSSYVAQAAACAHDFCTHLPTMPSQEIRRCFDVL